ncbi:dynein axonemal light chain 1 [Lethenteron reissneri]|uniref:dynein axonemal light chain 1 n=1 Tax=Lethenteron reissneri TaxID=7753 RepID=UPI002AB7BAF8|nr:dynein axonemal light chain 1 [Lethenteron reissneri]
MAKATSIKEAIAKWEEKAGEKAGEAKIVKLYAQYPPIEKMDASLSLLANCEKLSLSTNCIEKIANLNGLKFIKILSLGRNNIKNLSGLEAVGDTLEELWISYNNIEKLKGIHVLKKLRVLYMSNNLVKEWSEFVRLADLPALADLVFVGNPLEDKHSGEGNWMEEATRRLPRLKKLDGSPVIRQDEEEAEPGELKRVTCRGGRTRLMASMSRHRQWHVSPFVLHPIRNCYTFANIHRHTKFLMDN